MTYGYYTSATLAQWFIRLALDDGDPATDTAINDELQGDEKPEDTIEEEDVPLVKSDPVPEETE